MRKKAMSDEEKVLFTIEDRLLLWLPAVHERLFCPECKGEDIEVVRELDPTIDWGPTADPLPIGFKCKKCGLLMQDDLSPGISKVKTYEPYDVYLQRGMVNADYEWFQRRGSHDIRDYPYRRSEPVEL